MDSMEVNKAVAGILIAGIAFFVTGTIGTILVHTKPLDKPVLNIAAHQAGIDCATPISGGRQIFTADSDRNCKIWDAASGRELRSYAGDIAYLVTTAALLVVGAWASQVTGRALGAPDHGCIVIDEVVAFLVVLFFTGITPARLAIAFVLFRFFDIVKPPPIRQLDAALKNGAGVMLDDLLAAGYALLVLAVAQRLLSL